MGKDFKNKESEKKEKGDTVDKDVKPTGDKKGESIESKEKKKEPLPSPKGRGGQYVDIGGGVVIPASEVNN